MNCSKTETKSDRLLLVLSVFSSNGIHIRIEYTRYVKQPRIIIIRQSIFTDSSPVIVQIIITVDVVRIVAHSEEDPETVVLKIYSPGISSVDIVSARINDDMNITYQRLDLFHPLGRI